MIQNKIIDEMKLDSLHFVASIEVIQAGNVLAAIDFTESNELKLTEKIIPLEKRRGRPKLTEQQKSFVSFKRSAGKTKKFSVGNEPNKRID